MGKTENIHNNLFQKIFEEKENVRSFLKISLPKELLERVDFERIELDPTSYISDDMKGYFSDMVIKTKIIGKVEGKDNVSYEKEDKGRKKPSDIRKKAVAKNMIKMGLEIEVIVKATGLSEEEVRRIAKEVKRSRN